jgi:hypothetical protein
MKQLAKQAMWLARVSAFERSGLTRVEWCARAGLAVSTLDYWRRQVCEVPQAGSQVLVPVVLSETATATAQRAQVGVGAIEIDIGGGVRVRAGSGVDAIWLASLLRGLR